MMKINAVPILIVTTLTAHMTASAILVTKEIQILDVLTLMSAQPIVIIAMLMLAVPTLRVYLAAHVTAALILLLDFE